MHRTILALGLLAACGRDDPVQPDPPVLTPEAEKMVGIWLSGEEPHHQEFGAGYGGVGFWNNIMGSNFPYRFDADGTLIDAFCLRYKLLAEQRGQTEYQANECARQWSLTDTVFVIRHVFGKGPFPPDHFGSGHRPWPGPEETNPYEWADDDGVVSLTTTLSLKFVTDDSVMVTYPGGFLVDHYSSLTRLESMPWVEVEYE